MQAFFENFFDIFKKILRIYKIALYERDKIMKFKTVVITKKKLIIAVVGILFLGGIITAVSLIPPKTANVFNYQNEIYEDIKDLDVFVAGVGTGGTVSGIAKRLKELNPHIKVVAVEPKSSPVISGGNPGAHKIQGIGAGFIPGIYEGKYIDEVMTVDDNDAIRTAVEFAEKESVLIGISSGAAVYAAMEISKREGEGKKVLAIAPDGGEKYISMGIYG